MVASCSRSGRWETTSAGGRADVAVKGSSTIACSKGPQPFELAGPEGVRREPADAVEHRWVHQVDRFVLRDRRRCDRGSPCPPERPAG